MRQSHLPLQGQMLALALGLAGCRSLAMQAQPARAPGTTTLLLLGNTGNDRAETAKQRHFAAGVASRLAHERQGGGAPMVLWLGDDTKLAGPCSQPGWGGPGGALADAVAHHIRAGGPAFAALGERDRACAPLREGSLATQTAPARVPATHYVVRLDTESQATIVARCTAGRDCTPAPAASADTRVELVVIDISPWMFAKPALAKQVDETLSPWLDALQALSGAGAPLRLLVMHMPVESAGVHGLGGEHPQASFPLLPPVVRRALARGVFDGVLSAHEPALEVHRDLTEAIQRSAKVFIARPLFQLTVGTSSTRVRGTLPLFRSRFSTPTLASTQPSFVVIHASHDHVRVEVHMLRGFAWQQRTIDVPVDRRLRPAATPVGPIAPCSRCDPVPPDQRP